MQIYLHIIIFHIISPLINRKPVDHNILKHLNIDRRSEILALETENNANSTNQDGENEYNFDEFSRTSNAQHGSKKLPKKFGEQFHQEQNIPPPSFEEKKKVREQMFDYFEESAVEETRLVSTTCFLSLFLFKIVEFQS